MRLLLLLSREFAITLGLGDRRARGRVVGFDRSRFGRRLRRGLMRRRLLLMGLGLGGGLSLKRGLLLSHLLTLLLGLGLLLMR